MKPPAMIGKRRKNVSFCRKERLVQVLPSLLVKTHQIALARRCSWCFHVAPQHRKPPSQQLQAHQSPSPRFSGWPTAAVPRCASDARGNKGTGPADGWESDQMLQAALAGTHIEDARAPRDPLDLLLLVRHLHVGHLVARPEVHLQGRAGRHGYCLLW